MTGSARTKICVLAALSAGVLLAACTQSPSSTTSSSTSTSSAPPTTPTTTSSVPSTTSTVAATSTCQPSQLHIVELGSEGAAGTNEMTFTLSNTSSAECTLQGYPGMELLNAAGSDLPTVVLRGGGLSFTNLGVTPVTLLPGDMAYFNMGYNDVTTGTTTCSVATQVIITPPNDTTYAVVPVRTQIQACNGGTLNVSPMFGSTDSAATQTTTPSD